MVWELVRENDVSMYMYNDSISNPGLAAVGRQKHPPVGAGGLEGRGFVQWIQDAPNALNYMRM